MSYFCNECGKQLNKSDIKYIERREGVPLIIMKTKRMLCRECCEIWQHREYYSSRGD